VTRSIFDIQSGGVDPRAVEFRRWRIALGLNQPEAAGLLGISRSYLGRLEVGTCRTFDSIAARFADLQTRWDESMRPARGPEMRGSWKKRAAMSLSACAVSCNSEAAE